MHLRIAFLFAAVGLISYASAEPKSVDVVVRPIVIKIVKVITRVVKLTPEQEKELNALVEKEVTTIVDDWIKAGKPKLQPLNTVEITAQLKAAFSKLPCEIGKQVASGHTDLLEDVKIALDNDLADLVAGLNSVLSGLGTVVASLLVAVVELVIDVLLSLLDPIIDIAEDTVEGIIDLIP